MRWCSHKEESHSGPKQTQKKERASNKTLVKGCGLHFSFFFIKEFTCLPHKTTGASRSRYYEQN